MTYSEKKNAFPRNASVNVKMQQKQKYIFVLDLTVNHFKPYTTLHGELRKVFSL